MALQHVVLFSFLEELSTDDDAAMRAQVASWPSEIGGMNRLRFGGDLTGERTRGYSRLLYMEFDGIDELKRYQQHPVHQAFHRWLLERDCTPLAFDYFIDGDTDLMTKDRQNTDQRGEARP
jgi:Stress responsive A/B Barrel Domain